MLNLNYFDHNSPKNGYIQDIAKRDGWKYSRIGENIYTMTYARSKSLEMLNLNYFDHNSPKNGYIQDIAKRDGWKYSRIGENIYTMTGGQASSVSGASITNSWMNSEGHRKNILNSGYTDIGIGVTFNK